MMAPNAYGAHVVADDDDEELFHGLCEDCESRIRTAIQQGSDRCLTCSEGSA